MEHRGHRVGVLIAHNVGVLLVLEVVQERGKIHLQPIVDELRLHAQLKRIRGLRIVLIALKVPDVLVNTIEPTAFESLSPGAEEH